ncbi:MAG: 4-hydroxy-3-methylbut-2-enyl diphosphate reductase [bacterium]|nr:4-hydroxy-3-methylbut-2-enyl diphosphate reductase [bacterium]
MVEKLIDAIPIYKRGFGLKAEVIGELKSDYDSLLIDFLEANDYRILTPQVEILLAREFGFCYGVDRAVDYAYETRKRFPDRRLFLTAEIIHNPRVNRRLAELGIRFLTGQYGGENPLETLEPADVVLLPAFGVSKSLLARLQATGCILVDTTCGSVANVWRRVERYAREGYTSIIHGKYDHEETIATSSRAESEEGAKYLVVKDMAEAETVCAYIEGRGNRGSFLATFAKSSSKGFDPDLHLAKVGVANQTTMLSSESLAIARRIEESMIRRYGQDEASKRFLSFDTICSATQERQDAVIELAQSGLDLMIVVGGFNSSNTGHLCEIGAEHCPTFHIDEVSRIEGAERIRHKRPFADTLSVTEHWLPEGFRRIGFTAGASTPNQVIGEVIATVLKLKGVDVDSLVPAGFAPSQL